MTEVIAHKKRWPRVLVLVAASIVLHLMLVDWGKRHLVAGAAREEEPVLTVNLRPVQPPEKPVSMPVAKPKPAAAATKPTPRRAAPAHTPRAAEPSIEPPDEPIRETVVTVPAAPTSVDTTQTPPATAAATSGDGTAPGNAGQGETAAAPTPEPETPTAGTHYTTNPPPPAKLEYDVQATYNQMPVHGSGTLDWKTDGKTYKLDGKAEDFLFTFLNFSSTGQFDDFGVAPELYTEKRIRKAATNTHFNRERNQISFSASTEQYPRQGGEQDRASLVWQLSAIGRGDSGKFQPGAVIDMFVAGVRDGELWRIQVLDQEEIKVPAGTLQTWHVVRMPKPGSYDQRIDIWLAPQHEWYPVRLRYTDTRKDGDYLDMSLDKLTPH